MSRTSFTQFSILVDFMERNGDLSKPTGGPRGRQWCTNKWDELTKSLNSEGVGESRTADKWRKVWSDLKNNTKKKWAKINQGVNGTGGGPAVRIALSDLEERVMGIVGVRAATGMAVPELGFAQIEETIMQEMVQHSDETYSWPILDEDTWNTPGSSSDPTRAPPTQPLQTPRPRTAPSPPFDSLPPVSPPPASSPPVSSPPVSPSPASPPRPHMPPPAHTTSRLQMPPRPPTTSRPHTQPAPIIPQPPPSANANSQRTKRRRVTNPEAAFLRSESYARESERERDRVYTELERERIRQRDIELQLQAQWLEFMKDAMNVLVRYLDGNK